MYKKLPSDWKVLNFEECINSVRISGKLKIPEKEYKPTGKIPIIDQGKEYIAGYSDKKEHFTDFPAIIFGDHTRRFKYVDFPFLVGADGTKVLHPNEDLLDVKYAYYYLKNLQIENQGYQRHYKYLKMNSVIIPPINVQKDIVEKLDSIDKIIKYHIESTKLMNMLIKNIFLKLFGDISINDKQWPITTLDEIVSFKTKSTKPENFNLNDIYVGLDNIEPNKGTFINLNTVKNSNIKSNKNIFDKNMVLYGKLRPYLNKVAIPDFNGVCSTDIIPLSPKVNSNKYYVKFLLSSEYYVALSTEKSTGANLPRISPKILKTFEVPIPPLELQNKFETFVKSIEKLIKYKMQSQELLEKLLESSTKKALKGELIC